MYILLITLLLYYFIAAFFFVCFIKEILVLHLTDNNDKPVEFESKFKYYILSGILSMCWPFIIYKVIKGGN